MNLDLKKTRSRRLTGKVVEHFEAITDARQRGVEWGQITAAIGPLVGIDPNDKDARVKMRQAYHRARRGVEKGRLRSNASLDVPGAGTAPPADAPQRSAEDQEDRRLPPLRGAGQEKPAPKSRAGFKRISLD